MEGWREGGRERWWGEGHITIIRWKVADNNVTDSDNTLKKATCYVWRKDRLRTWQFIINQL
jgi:hypothetical protein